MAVKFKKAKVKLVPIRSTVSQVLLAAIEAIRLRGWVQGTTENWEGRVCAAGALRLVCGDSHPKRMVLRQHARRELEHQIWRRLHESRSVESFNDARGRRVSSVLSVFRAAAKRAAQQEAQEAALVR